MSSLPTRGTPNTPFTFDEAMRRLGYLMGAGCVVVVVYAVGPDFLLTATIGLMLALASALGVGLIGFIFGVPFSKDAAGAAPKVAGAPDRAESEGSPSSYRANTSLEQISDWLTKMLVGVGLVEIKEAPAALHRLVQYLAPGVGTGRQAETFVLSVLVFFAVSGFLFGFLWARLYLRRWLSDADRDLIEKLSRFDADAKAYSLVTRQLERREDESPVREDELRSAIHSASSSEKARIFEQATQASKDTEASDYYDIKNPGAIAIFQALINEDSQARYHRNHAELGYALDRRRPPDLVGSVAAISEAIKRRDQLRKTGWRYYEFRRARNLIRQDANYAAGKQSSPEALKSIADDIKAAKAGDPEKFDRWLADHSEVNRWLQLNGVNV
jgi:hypothetical protein